MTRRKTSAATATTIRQPRPLQRRRHAQSSPFVSLYAYQGEQFWDSLSSREQQILATSVRRWQSLERAAIHAYEIGRLDEAELLDEEAERAAANVESFLDEIESESVSEGEAETDLLAELASLYETYRSGHRSLGSHGLGDRKQLVDTLRYAVESYAGGQPIHASDQELYDAAEDAWSRVYKLRHRQAARDTTSQLLTRAHASRTAARHAGARKLRHAIRATRGLR